MCLIRERRWKLRDDLGRAMFPVAHASLHRIADMIRSQPDCDVRTDWRWMPGGRELSGEMVIRWDRVIDGQSYGCQQALTAWELEASTVSDEHEMRIAIRLLRCVQEAIPKPPPEHVPFDIAPYAALFREMPEDYQPPTLNVSMAVDGAQLVPGQEFGRSVAPSSDDGIYRVSTGQWSDRK